MQTGQKNRPCGFCKKPCIEPKFLPCTHAFCKMCLKFQITQVPTNRQWEGFSCPRCKNYIKARDPDQPLASWADQFPDTLLSKKPGSIEETAASKATAKARPPTGRGHLGSPVEPESPSTPVSGPASPVSLGPASPVSPGPASPPSPAPVSPQSPAPVSPQYKEPITPKSPRPVSPDPGSSLPLEPMSPKQSDRSISIELSTPDKTDAPDSVFTPPVSPVKSNNETACSIFQDSMTDAEATQGEKNEHKMCAIHLWKPIFMTCRKCDSLACGQCLTESHPTCTGEDFYPISEVSVLPNMSQLEEEVHKITPLSDMMTSSSYQLHQTRELIRQKIKLVALHMIQSMKRQEEEMVTKVQQLYHDEIWRLKSGINPSEGLLKQVQQLKHQTEDLTKLHSAAVLLQGDDIMNKQNVLLGKLKAMDFACVPPDIQFDGDYETLTITLGDLVVDQGFYPKHDVPKVPDVPNVPDVPVEVAPETLAVADVPDVAKVPDAVEVAASSRSTKSSSDQAVPKKSKAKSLMGRLLSPKQKSKSNFFVKVPEL